MPVKIIKENKFTFSKLLSKMFNLYIDNVSFPNGLKKADIKPVYTPISIIPVKHVLKFLNAAHIIEFMHILILIIRSSMWLPKRIQ